MDVINVLSINSCVRLSQSFNRPNLKWEVREKTGKIDEDINAFISTYHPGESGIIYCTSRAACEAMATKLQKNFHLHAAFYHAGLDKSARIKVQREWLDNKVQIIVATIAFGMGIDKSNVRFVIHYSLPGAIEGYYQETGRAGRDGRNSTCILYYRFGDKNTVNFSESLTNK